MRVIHFGSQTLGSVSGALPDAYYRAKTSADRESTCQFSESSRLTVGGSLGFDGFPSRQDPDESDHGHIYDSAQFGPNGAAWPAPYWVSF